jgi:outer membrane murein-binding lipoprotein Lpp
MKDRRRFTLALAVILTLAALAGCSGDADFSDAMPAPVTLSAEQFQPEIMEIDRLVFGAGSLTDARRNDLSRRLESLAARVKASGESRFLLIESLELKRFASASKSFPDVPAARASVQNNWMRIRSNLFDDRAWFARSAADLAPSAR